MAGRRGHPCRAAPPPRLFPGGPEHCPPRCAFFLRAKAAGLGSSWAQAGQRRLAATPLRADGFRLRPRDNGGRALREDTATSTQRKPLLLLRSSGSLLLRYPTARLSGSLLIQDAPRRSSLPSPFMGVCAFRKEKPSTSPRNPFRRRIGSYNLRPPKKFRALRALLKSKRVRVIKRKRS